MKSKLEAQGMESRVCRLTPRWRASVSSRKASMRGAIGVMIASLWRMNSSPAAATSAHEFGRGLQVPVGRIDVDVTHVGRERRHMRGRFGFDPADCLAACALQTCAGRSCRRGRRFVAGTTPALSTSLSNVSLTAM